MMLCIHCGALFRTYAMYARVQTRAYWLARLSTDRRPTFSSPVRGGANLNGIGAEKQDFKP